MRMEIMDNQNVSKYKVRTWSELDRIYTFCRRQLNSKPDWRYGPARVHEVAKEGFEGISKYTTLQNKVYCDLVCGTYHPYGISAVMFLNGSSSTISIDLHGSNKQRAAEALADLLCDCCWTDRWNWSSVDKLDFLSRVQQFDMQALREGRLDDGLAGLGERARRAVSEAMGLPPLLPATMITTATAMTTITTMIMTTIMAIRIIPILMRITPSGRKA